MLCYVILFCLILYYVMLYYVILYYVLLYCIKYYSILLFIMLYYIMLYCIIFTRNSIDSDYAEAGAANHLTQLEPGQGRLLSVSAQHIWKTLSGQCEDYWDTESTMLSTLAFAYCRVFCS